MNPQKNDEVAEWMESLGFTNDPAITANGYFYKEGVGYVSPIQAAFFYNAVAEARLEATIQTHDTYWHMQRAVEEEGIGPIALRRKEHAESELAALRGKQ